MTDTANELSLALPSGEHITWSSTAVASGVKDTALERGAAGVVAATDAAGGRGAVDHDRTVTAGITASTTQTQGQMPLTSEVNEVSVVANANDTVTLPSAAPGRKCVIQNNGANTLQIFPALGDDAGAGVDVAITLATGLKLVLDAYDATNWF